MGGRVGLGGRRPDPGLLVPDASRQEAEANIRSLNHLSVLVSPVPLVLACPLDVTKGPHGHVPASSRCMMQPAQGDTGEMLGSGRISVRVPHTVFTTKSP